MVMYVRPMLASDACTTKVIKPDTGIWLNNLTDLPSIYNIANLLKQI